MYIYGPLFKLHVTNTHTNTLYVHIFILTTIHDLL